MVPFLKEYRLYYSLESCQVGSIFFAVPIIMYSVLIIFSLSLFDHNPIPPDNFKKYSRKVNLNINILEILIFRIHTRQKQA